MEWAREDIAQVYDEAGVDYIYVDTLLESDVVTFRRVGRIEEKTRTVGHLLKVMSRLNDYPYTISSIDEVFADLGLDTIEHKGSPVILYPNEESNESFDSLDGTMGYYTCRF